MRSLVALLLIATATRAAADEEPRHEVTLDGMSAVGSSRSTVGKRTLLLPGGALEVGADLSFLTADPVPGGGRELQFTDIGLFRVHGRYSIKGRVEIAAAVVLLPKQPSYSEESVYQHSSLGLRVGLGSEFAAGVAASGGVNLDQAGGFWTAQAGGVEWKPRIDPTVNFELGLGVSSTQLRDLDYDDDNLWLVETDLRGEIQLKTPGGELAVYAGSDIHFVVAHEDPLDPQTRLNFHLGALYGLVPYWSIYADLAVIDRGDPEDSATILPILDGGFDQSQLTIGILRRFGTDEHKSSWY